MQTTLHFLPTPRFARLLIALALAVATIGIAIFAAGALPRHADPFGPAHNGTLVYGASDGDIYAIDPVTNASTAIVTGPMIDFAPFFSPDGARLAFVRAEQRTGPFVLMLAGADGTRPRPLSGPLTGLELATWSPDGSRIAVTSELGGEPTLWILGIDGSTVRLLPSGTTAEYVQWRPNGSELMFRGLTSGPGRPTYGLYVVRADGTGMSQIVPPSDSGDLWQSPALSPDGEQVVYTQWDPDIGGRLWVVAIDGGQPQELAFEGTTEGDWGVRWSPDGLRLVFNRLDGTGFERLVVASASGGKVIDIGPRQPEFSGGVGAEFSPDGSSVVARYADGSAWILPVSGAPGQRLPASDFIASWQRRGR